MEVQRARRIPWWQSQRCFRTTCHVQRFGESRMHHSCRQMPRRDSVHVWPSRRTFGCTLCIHSSTAGRNIDMDIITASHTTRRMDAHGMSGVPSASCLVRTSPTRSIPGNGIVRKTICSRSDSRQPNDGNVATFIKNPRCV